MEYGHPEKSASEYAYLMNLILVLPFQYCYLAAKLAHFFKKCNFLKEKEFNLIYFFLLDHIIGLFLLPNN